MALGVEEQPTTPLKPVVHASFATPPASPAFTKTSCNHSTSSSDSMPTTPPTRRRQTKRKRNDSSSDYSPPSSVQSRDSFGSSTSSAVVPSTSSATTAPAVPRKRRGRPPKTESRPISPTELLHMNESDARYVQMRNKNNEASRKSRINRKDREQTLEAEADELMVEHAHKQSLEQRLEQRVQRLKEALKSSMLEA